MRGPRSRAYEQRLRRTRWLLWSLLLALASPLELSAQPELDLRDTTRLRVGIGDRLSLQRAGHWVRSLAEIQRRDLEVDFVQLWLTRDWEPSWIRRADLDALADAGVTPIVVHYFFGDFISQQRIEAQHAEWFASLARMADHIRGPSPVLVILEPEFNIAPPPGETAVIAWPGFSDHLRDAARMIRQRAPNARVGVCVGDFPGTPHLERVLGPVAPELDFLGFQEMRAASDVRAGETNYLAVGRSATRFARYLQRAFDRPLLIGYVAVSSYGGWEALQAEALQDLLAHRDALREAGVFGWVYFQLFDDPTHVGYFGPAERSFGLVTEEGAPKPALEVFRKFFR